jgi:hypothetical protein
MEEELWSVKNKLGDICPIVASTPTEALKAAAKVKVGRSGASAVGKIVLEGCQPVRVRLVVFKTE